MDSLPQTSITHAASADGTFTVTVVGEIDVFNSENFEATLGQANGSRLVVVDLRQCRYIDSATISVLIRARKKSGDNLRILANGMGAVRRVLELTNLSDIIPVVSSPEELSA